MRALTSGAGILLGVASLAEMAESVDAADSQPAWPVAAQANVSKANVKRGACRAAGAKIRGGLGCKMKT